MLSIVIPSGRSSACTLLARAIQSLDQMTSVEIIFVDQSEAQSRAERLNIGFHRAKGEVILFHHPRSWVDPIGIQKLIDLSQDATREASWGGFTHRFDHSHPLLRFTSWYSNNIRARRRGIVYLDHCVFFDRSLWRVDLPKVDIFEDTILSVEFRKTKMPMLLPHISLTSAIRFKEKGIFRQALLNQLMKLAYYVNLPHRKMNRIYEKNLELNSKYSKKKDWVSHLTLSEITDA